MRKSHYFRQPFVLKRQRQQMLPIFDENTRQAKQ
jgi:hypothetical protein